MEVSVNRVSIDSGEINRESGRIEVGSITERWEEAARRLVVRELLRQRAVECGFDAAAERHQGDEEVTRGDRGEGDEGTQALTEAHLDQIIERLLGAEVTIPEPDTDACLRYFKSNRERFRTPVETDVRHVLLPAAPDAGAERVAARETAEEVIERLQTGDSDFAAEAAAHSACPSREQGGRLGWVGRGQTVPELERTLLRLESGLASRPVETRYGFHVVEVLDRRGGEPLAFEDVQHLIADFLAERSWRRAVSQYIGCLAAAADIRGIDLGVDDSPLVQ